MESRDSLKQSAADSALTTLFLTLVHELNTEELRSEGIREESIYIRTQAIRAGLLLMLNYHPARILITPFLQHYFYFIFMDDKYQTQNKRYGFFHEKLAIHHLNTHYKPQTSDEDTRKDHEKDLYLVTEEIIEPDPTAEAIANHLTLFCFALYDIYSNPASLSESIPTVFISAAASYVTKHTVEYIHENYKQEGLRGIPSSLYRSMKNTTLWLMGADPEATSISVEKKQNKAWQSFSF